MDVFSVCYTFSYTTKPTKLHSIKKKQNTVKQLMSFDNIRWFLTCLKVHLCIARYDFCNTYWKNKWLKGKKAALDRIPSTFTWRLTYTMHFSRKVCYLPFSPFSGFCHLYGIRATAYKRHASKTIEAFSIWICLVI